MVNIEIRKTGLNSDSKFAELQNDFETINDVHPNVKIDSSRIGVVDVNSLIPKIGESYHMNYTNRFSQFLTTDVKKVIGLNKFVTNNSIYTIKLLDRLINFSYEIDYKNVTNFVFDKKNEIVDLTDYVKLVNEIFRISKILQTDANSRKAVIVLAENNEKVSCLINLQFLIKDEELICIANYRSQHFSMGAQHDINMLNYLTTLIIADLKKEFKKITIKVNVADFHDYDVISS